MLTTGQRRFAKHAIFVLAVLAAILLPFQEVGVARPYLASVLLLPSLGLLIVGILRPVLRGLLSVAKAGASRLARLQERLLCSAKESKAWIAFRSAVLPDSTSSEPASLQSGGFVYVLLLAFNILWFLASTLTSGVQDPVVKGLPWWNKLFAVVLDLNIVAQLGCLSAAMGLVIGQHGVKRLDRHFGAWVLSFALAFFANIQALVDTHFHHPPDVYLGWKWINGITLTAYLAGAWMIAVQGWQMKRVLVVVFLLAIGAFVALPIFGVQI